MRIKVAVHKSAANTKAPHSCSISSGFETKSLKTPGFQVSTRKLGKLQVNSKSGRVVHSFGLQASMMELELGRVQVKSLSQCFNACEFQTAMTNCERTLKKLSAGTELSQKCPTCCNVIAFSLFEQQINLTSFLSKQRRAQRIYSTCRTVMDF